MTRAEHRWVIPRHRSGVSPSAAAWTTSRPTLRCRACRRWLPAIRRPPWRRRWAGLPGGTAFGSLVHAVLETVDHGVGRPRRRDQCSRCRAALTVGCPAAQCRHRGGRSSRRRCWRSTKPRSGRRLPGCGCVIFSGRPAGRAQFRAAAVRGRPPRCPAGTGCSRPVGTPPSCRRRVWRCRRSAGALR